MKILLLNRGFNDYLADGVFHGFRTMFGSDVIDYPRCDWMYKDFSEVDKLHGKGFSLYRTLKSIKIDRYNIYEKVRNSYFDLIVFGSIHDTFGTYFQLFPYLKKNSVIFLDGNDHPAPFPFHSYFWRTFRNLCVPKVSNNFLYFKREWTPETTFYRYYKVMPKSILNYLPNLANYRKINFGFPSEKIIKVLPKKSKLFNTHIVDPEVKQNIKGASLDYAFAAEKDYYNDLKASKFGITTKKGGWDCMRHYEIAANGTVPCFRDLDKKPDSCAPHGFDSTNSITYSSYHDLLGKISSISDEEYASLQSGALKWIKGQTTVNIAKKILKEQGI